MLIDGFFIWYCCLQHGKIRKYFFLFTSRLVSFSELQFIIFFVYASYWQGSAYNYKFCWHHWHIFAYFQDFKIDTIMIGIMLKLISTRQVSGTCSPPSPSSLLPCNSLKIGCTYFMVFAFIWYILQYYTDRISVEKGL